LNEDVSIHAIFDGPKPLSDAKAKSEGWVSVRLSLAIVLSHSCREASHFFLGRMLISSVGVLRSLFANFRFSGFPAQVFLNYFKLAVRISNHLSLLSNHFFSNFGKTKRIHLKITSGRLESISNNYSLIVK
jgi:hypothetical protein